MAQQVADAAGHARLFIPCAEHDTSQPGENDRAGTHGAWLERDHERAVLEPVSAVPTNGVFDGEEFGVRQRSRGTHPVPRGGDNLLSPDDHRSHRHLVRFSRLGRETERHPHQRLGGNGGGMIGRGTGHAATVTDAG